MTTPTFALLESAPRVLFFTGKGGMGKTTLACAVAVALADGGKRVILVGTDPASNLDEMLGTPLAGSAVPVPPRPYPTVSFDARGAPLGVDGEPGAELFAAGSIHDLAITLSDDAKRMVWAAYDMARDRPPLSRWHGDYQQAFKDFTP